MRFRTLRGVVATSALAMGCGSVSNTPPDASTTDDPDASSPEIDAGPDASGEQAPVNERSNGTVPEGGLLDLDGDLVTTDGDDPASALVYTVVTLPANGELRRGTTALAAGETFTQQDVDDGVVTYQHAGGKDTSDTFQWTLTDGVTTLPAAGSIFFDIVVTSINDTPVVEANSLPSVAEAGTTLLDNTMLLVSDAEGVVPTYTFLSASRGVLQKWNGASFVTMGTGEVFTQADIAAGFIRYVDSGADDAMLAQQQPTVGSFDWRATDGAGGWTPSEDGANTSQFTVTSVNDPASIVWRTGVCYTGSQVNANPVQSFSDPDNAVTTYDVCFTGTSEVCWSEVVCNTTTGGLCVTVTNCGQGQVSDTSPAVVLTVGACRKPNDTSDLVFNGPAGAPTGGTAGWQLRVGPTVHSSGSTNFSSASCP